MDSLSNSKSPGTSAHLGTDVRPDRPIRVVLVEDHAMVATALAGVLDAEDDIEMMATAGTVAEARELVSRVRPGVLVADQHLPDGSIEEHVGALVEAVPGMSVLVVSGLPTEHAFVAAMDAGSAGFLSKSQPMDELVDAVRRVAAGAVVVAPELLPSLVRRIDGRVRHRVLTGRELEILQQLAEGRSTTQIAERLVLSRHTVRNHVARLSLKLGAHSRLEAVSIGTRRGLIAPAAP